MPEANDRRRRELLRYIGASTVIGAGVSTGCLGADEGMEDGEEADNNVSDGGGANETDADEAATTEPVDFPADANCAVCNMVAADYPDWNAQVAHDDGERAYLCSSGCTVAYKTYPDEFAVSSAPTASVWVTGYETRELIDGAEAFYALETDPERVDDVMMLNPAPFEERNDAVEYVDAVEYLTEDDIVGYEQLDAETADIYRGQLTPSGEDANEDA
ncbi:nitrous oxide reductase accessory protein NosL [Haladaptatus sp. F3-133]|uniref:Nitrous oxide reductase accessory protein NosL n=1 Tax=Halorutilus salinus TaxID=2487751 RepID=A0A9Q4C2X2_9EURY|nr:nitrous oxide reductase accessory protein NosL [Halorutilus salinus]MCX2818865.1 nitrous oxide reductase accessory protein NosL [Halorutilus salinus]